MRKKLLAIPLFLFLLAGCQILGLQQPQTSKEKISYIRASTDAVEKATIKLYTEKNIQKETAQDIYNRAGKVYDACDIVEAAIKERKVEEEATGIENAYAEFNSLKTTFKSIKK